MARNQGLSVGARGPRGTCEPVIFNSINVAIGESTACLVSTADVSRTFVETDLNTHMPNVSESARGAREGPGRGHRSVCPVRSGSRGNK